MKDLIAKQSAFMTEASALLKEEKFEELVKCFEANALELTTLTKYLEEEEGKAEELEKQAIEKAEKEEAVRLKKYAEIFANAESLSDLIEQLKEANEKISGIETSNSAIMKRLEDIEKAPNPSKQPEEVKKEQIKADGMDELGAFFKGN